MKNNTLAEDCGRLFEVGFNIGILTCIRQHADTVTHHLDSLYVDDLHNLHFSEMMREAFKRTKFSLSQHKRQVAKQWFMFFLQKGFLAGLNFFQEYLASLHLAAGTTVEIAYYQCSFSRENSISTHMKTDENEWRDILSQFADYGLDAQHLDLHAYKATGKFLRADCLMLLRIEGRWRILSVDLSVFSVTSPDSMKDANDISVVRRLLLNDLGYLRSKSVFSNLSIDTTGDPPGFAFSKGLETYFTAFKLDDKESVKLIQAGSYAYDFYTFLKKHSILTPVDDVTLNVIGYTDRGMNAMSVKDENIEVLETCARIYQYDSNEQEIQTARQNVLEMVSNNAARSFHDGASFTSAVLGLADSGEDGVYWLDAHQEWEEQFVCPWDKLPLERICHKVIQRIGEQRARDVHLLDAHKILVQQELAVQGAEASTYLFLTGNPGIGKTTAIADFLLEHRDEGFLFFYVSPRKQVNLDIINKFRISETGPLHDNVLALTSNSILIHNNQGRATVQYESLCQHGAFCRHGADTTVYFQEVQAEQEVRRWPVRSRSLEQFQEDRIRASDVRGTGVMNSICNALQANMLEPISNQIIATVAIQSLKKTADSDTLKHLNKIFKHVYNEKKNKVIPEKMKELARRIHHIFIMVDEITGDEGGVEFLAGINRFVNRFHLTDSDYGFNTKVIVADASVVDHKVIEQHLTSTDYSPDKIYFRRVESNESAEPLSRQAFTFRNRNAVMINANSYPARRLHLTYNVGIEFSQYQETPPLNAKDHLVDSVQEKMTSDLIALLDRPDVPQVIVYIQDKRRLVRLISALHDHYGDFQKDTHYLEIHANISEKEKESIRHHKNEVRVIFMTASASRGLSFPNTTHILIDVPRFEIEQNLMEIIQVIYRGRGDREKDQRDKALSFYLTDHAVYYDEENRQLARRESTLNLLNMLLILKTSIMTRIVGSGRVGLHNFVMIPIGGKSVIAAGETFAGKMARLIASLQSEYHRRPQQKWLEEVYMSLHELFSAADFSLSSPAVEPRTSPATAPTSYLSLLTTFSSRFEDAAYNGFDRLLDWEPFQNGYISSGLLIVPLAEKKLQERYLMELATRLVNVRDSELWRKMQRIAADPEYYENLRTSIQEAIELIELLAKAPQNRTQQLIQDSQQGDLYYAIPLLSFMYRNVMKDYFSNTPGDIEQYAFRTILTNYMRSLYPISTTLPIGDGYAEFPFIVFRSFTLKEARSRLFADNYLLISHEMNVLNMLLSYRRQ